MIEDDAPEVDALPVLAEPATIVSQREPAPDLFNIVSVPQLSLTRYPSPLL